MAQIAMISHAVTAIVIAASAQTIFVDDELTSIVVRGVGADRVVEPSRPLVLDSASISRRLGGILASPPDYARLEPVDGVRATAAPLSDFVTCEDPRRYYDCQPIRAAVFVTVDSARQSGDTVRIGATRLVIQPGADARRRIDVIRAVMTVLREGTGWRVLHPLYIRTG